VGYVQIKIGEQDDVCWIYKMQLPDELRLDIAEYTAIARDTDRYSSMGVSDLELLHRIRRYEPSFNYNVWRQHLQKKKHLQELYLQSPSMALIKIADEYPKDILITIYKLNTNFNKRPIPDLFQDLLGRISNTTGVSIENLHMMQTGSEYTLIINDRSGIFADFESVHAFVHPYTEITSVEYGIVLFNNPSMQKIWIAESNPRKALNEIAIIATTPNTLEEYLSHVASRDQHGSRIRRDRLFSLYELFIDQPYQVEYSTDDNGHWLNMLFVSDSNITLERILSVLPPDLQKYVISSKESIIGNTKDICIGGNDKMGEIFHDLFEIHRYFFPLRYSECS